MKTKEYVIETKKVDDELNIAILSQLHLSHLTKQKKIADIFDTLDWIEPSAIVIPGNLYNSNSIFMNSDIVSNFFKEATSIADVYYLKGHTDGINGGLNNLDADLDISTKKKVHLLNNNPIMINDCISITGINFNPKFYTLKENEKVKKILLQYKKYLQTLSSQIDESKYNILVSPDSSIIEVMHHSNIPQLNFDLTITNQNNTELPKSIMTTRYNISGKDKTSRQDYLMSEGITKYHSDMRNIQILDKFHKSTLENVRILAKK